MRRIVMLFVACLPLTALTPVSAHLNTNLAGALNGTLRPASPTFQFKGEAAFAGQYQDVASAVAYTCTASGPNEGITPWGGPFEGTYSCTATGNRIGAAPGFVTGPLKGYTNAASVAMSGTFSTHRINCSGAVYPSNVTLGLFVELSVLMECVIQ